MGSNSVYNFAKKHGRLIAALVFTVYSCRYEFIEDIGFSVDGSWIRSLNMALHNGLIFGNQYIFTYGPLGFLGTRNAEYIWPGYMLLGDLLRFAGFFYLVYKYLPLDKWWLPILFGATILMRSTNYAQALFLLFIIYASILLVNKRVRVPVLVFCGLYGAMLFFIKLNYSFISLLLIVYLIALLAIKERRNALILLAVTTTTFVSIYCSVNIDIAAYVSNSWPIMRDYDEAMVQQIDPTIMPYKSAMYFFVATGCLLVYYIVQELRNKSLTLGKLSFAGLCLLVCFIFYKNGFTRYDRVHYMHFFFAFPLLFIAIGRLTGHGRTIAVKLAAAGIVIYSFWNFAGINSSLKRLTRNDVRERLAIGQYYTGIVSGYKKVATPAQMRFGKETIDKIGNGTIDILPHEISLLQINHLHYHPRPVPQSYTAYGSTLDEMNAHFFISNNRPQWVLIRNLGIDERYFAWDEAITKATLYLNYSYDTLASLQGTDMPEGDEPFLLMKAKEHVHMVPVFEKAGEITANIGEVINVPESTHPLFMTVEVPYTLAGKINKLIYQPALFEMTLITSDSAAHKYRFVPPIARGLVPVSHFIDNTTDLQNFMTGHFDHNKRITSFVIGTKNTGIKKPVKVTFYRFVNY